MTLPSFRGGTAEQKEEGQHTRDVDSVASEAESEGTVRPRRPAVSKSRFSTSSSHSSGSASQRHCRICGHKHCRCSQSSRSARRVSQGAISVSSSRRQHRQERAVECPKCGRSRRCRCDSKGASSKTEGDGGRRLERLRRDSSDVVNERATQRASKAAPAGLSSSRWFGHDDNDDSTEPVGASQSSLRSLGNRFMAVPVGSPSDGRHLSRKRQGHEDGSHGSSDTTTTTGDNDRFDDLIDLSSEPGLPSNPQALGVKHITLVSLENEKGEIETTLDSIDSIIMKLRDLAMARRKLLSPFWQPPPPSVSPFTSSEGDEHDSIDRRRWHLYSHIETSWAEIAAAYETRLREHEDAVARVAGVEDTRWMMMMRVLDVVEEGRMRILGLGALDSVELMG